MLRIGVALLSGQPLGFHILWLLRRLSGAKRPAQAV